MSPAAIHMSVTNGHAAAGLGAPGGPSSNEDCGIREVWAHNMEEEFKTICQVSKLLENISNGSNIDKIRLY